MAFVKMDFNKYENYIRVGYKEDGSDMENFPTPSSLGRELHDVDVDAYTDLRGFTQRNRVRHDVEKLKIGYSILSPNDEAYILNRISPVWIYVELIDKKTRMKKICKMYAGDKKWDVHRAMKNENGQWYEESLKFEFSLVEQ